MKFTLHEKNDSFQALIVLGMLLMLCMGACQYALSQIMYREAETNMVEKTVQSRHLIDERIKKYYETLRYVNSVAESQTNSRSELNEYIQGKSCLEGFYPHRSSYSSGGDDLWR